MTATIILFVKEVKISSAEIQDFYQCPITAWEQNAVPLEDCQKWLKVVFTSLMFRNLHVSAEIAEIICSLLLPNGAFVTVQVLDTMSMFCRELKQAITEPHR